MWTLIDSWLSSTFPRYCELPPHICWRSTTLTNHFGRELQKRIEDINTPSSIYNISRTDTMTDATIYTPNRDWDQTDTKKRKRGPDNEIVNGVDGNAGSGAVYTGQVKTNAHLRTVHTELKAEYEELGSLCVSCP